jgi:CheY-like chemotaxis protein
VEFALRGSSVRSGLQIPDNLWSVVVDEGQISQVLQNLIINAEQAMLEGGVIDVTVANDSIPSISDLPLKPGDYVRISVTDHGIGIPQDHLSKIFDPYFTTKQKGSGLGLATTYSIIKRHEGHITVTSALGQGACFTFYLPASFLQESTQQEAPDDLISGKGRILVMDDEEEIQEVLGAMLQHLGFDVDFASDGNIAMQNYAQALDNGSPYSATILDLTIPGGMGGKEALRQIKSLHPEATVIVSSGYSNDPVLARFHEFGFSGVIAKPYNLIDLSKVLSQVL